MDIYVVLHRGRPKFLPEFSLIEIDSGFGMLGRQEFVPGEGGTAKNLVQSCFSVSQAPSFPAFGG